MTKDQKQFILISHQRGKSYAEIAEELKLSPNTVKSVCKRNSQGSTPGSEADKSTCKQCGVQLVQTPHHRVKSFCSDKCRLAWWHSNRERAGSAIPHTCPFCGSTFVADKGRKYCSHSCYIKARFA